MNPDILAYLILSVCFLLIFLLGDLMLHYFKVQVEYSRKTVHVLSGLLACAFPIYFSNYWWVFAICASFIVLLFISLKFNLLKGINSVERKTYGSIVYPIGVFFSFVFYSVHINRYVFEPYFLFYIPLLILTFSDPLAAIVGKNFPIKRFSDKPGSKSWGGSGAFFLSAFVLSYFLLPPEFRSLTLALVLALVTMQAESWSKSGLDNIFIPLSAMLVLYIFLL